MPIACFPPSNFLQLGADDFVDRPIIDVSERNNVAVQDPQTSARHGAHRELLVRWNPELAYDNHVEIHDRVERSVVYPALAPYYGPLIRAFLTEHDEISSCIAMRDGRNSGGDLLVSLDRLEHLARDHIGREESSLLAAFERDQPGLNARLYGSIVAEKERLAGAVEDLESRS